MLLSMSYCHVVLIVFSLLAWGPVAFAGGIEEIDLKPSNGIDRAQVCYLKEEAPKVAILVLCPGFDDHKSNCRSVS